MIEKYKRGDNFDKLIHPKTKRRMDSYCHQS